MNSLVFIDTSVWVGALRGTSPSILRKLRALIDEDRAALAAPVRLELLSGASQADFKRLSQDLAALPTFYPSRSTWERIENWIEAAVEAGERFGVGDLLIAAIASEAEGTLWSLDRDFARLAKLGFVTPYFPEG